MTAQIPDTAVRLLTDANIGVLAVGRPDGSIIATPMWFLFDDGLLKFTHTTTRAKYRALQTNPHMTLTVLDPDTPYKYLELRGELAEVTPDPTGAFFDTLAKRYDSYSGEPVPDAADRVILAMRIEKALTNRT